MTVVRNEFERGENNPQRVLLGRMLASAYHWHNYGNLPIGARSDIENVDIERLQAFYRMYYQPDNAVLIVAGQFDPDPHAGGRSRSTSARFPKPARTLPAMYTKDPVQDGERTVTLRRVGGTQFVAALYHTVPGAASRHVATGGAGRRDGRRTLGPAVQGAGRNEEGDRRREPGTSRRPTRATSSSGRRCRTTDSIAAARDAMFATVEDVSAKPITEAEVDRVRAKALRQFDETSSIRSTSASRFPSRSRWATGGSSSCSATGGRKCPRPTCSGWRSTT